MLRLQYSLTIKTKNMKKLILSAFALAIFGSASFAQSNQQVILLKFEDGSAAYVKNVTGTSTSGDLATYKLSGVVGTENQMSINISNPPSEAPRFHLVVFQDADGVYVVCVPGGYGGCDLDIKLPLQKIQNAVSLLDGTIIYSNMAGYTTDADGNITGVIGIGDISSSTGVYPSCMETDGNKYVIPCIESVNREAVIMNTPTNHNDLGW